MNNNVLEFYVKMKDLMSSGLTKVAQNAKKTFSSVDGYIDKTIAKVKQLGNSFKDTGTNMAKFFKGGGASGGFGSFLKGTGIGVALAGIVSTAAIAGIVKDSVDKAVAFESTKKSFEVLTGSKKAGIGLSGQLNALQRDTILGPEVFKSAQTLLAFGIATDKVMPSLKMLGDVSMGDAEKLNSLTLAFAQTNSAGKLTGQDLLQYVNAGFNPLAEMARTSGKSIAFLRKEMEKGNITSDMVIKAFETATSKGGKFNDMMNQMATTTGGKMAQLDGQIESDLTRIGDKFKDASVMVLQFKASIISLIAGTEHLQDSIIGEKSAINTLVGAITSANTTNEVRLSLLGDLKKAYPDLFGNIDIEKTKNGELLAMLEDINGAYEKRIKLATDKDNFNTLTADANEAFNKLKFYTQMNEKLGNGADLKGQKVLEDRYKAAVAKLKAAKDIEDKNNQDVTLQSLYDFTKSESNLQGLGKNRLPFLHMINAWRSHGFAAGGGTEADLKKALDMMKGVTSAAGIKGGGSVSAGDTGKGGSGKSVASGITGGGPRVININGLNMKLADKIEVKAVDAKGMLNELEPQMEDFFLRIINSGAAVQ